MNRRNFRLPAVALLATGLLVACCATSVARGQNGMPGTPQGSTNSSKTLAERSLAGALLSNIRAETQFSKVALKNSTDAQLKKLARQVISQNGKLDAQLVTLIAGDSVVNNEVYNFGHLTSRARDTERQLKKLHGTDFDRAYVAAMDQYGQKARTMISDHSTLVALSRPRTQRLISRIQIISEQNSKQLHELAG